MFYKIPGEVKQLLKELGNAENGYVFMLLLRRKWIISNGYLSDEEAREKFPSSEICIGRCYVPGHQIEDKLDYKINQMLSVITDGVDKKIKIKSIKHSIRDLYMTYPNAFSLMFTFPRDTVKAFKKYTKKLIDVGLNADMNQLHHLCHHCDQEWLSTLQKTSHKKYVFGLIDIDENLVSKYSCNEIKQIIEEFSKDLRLNIVYVVTTIRGGVHIIVELNKDSGRLMFAKKQQHEILCALQEKFNRFNSLNVEILTTTTVLTHLPFNKNVRLLKVNYRIVSNKYKEDARDTHLDQVCEIVFKDGKDSVIGRITGHDFDENYNIRRIIIDNQISVDTDDILTIKHPFTQMRRYYMKNIKFVELSSGRRYVIREAYRDDSGNIYCSKMIECSIGAYDQLIYKESVSTVSLNNLIHIPKNAIAFEVRIVNPDVLDERIREELGIS